jgi:hypothetical protein
MRAMGYLSRKGSVIFDQSTELETDQRKSGAPAIVVAGWEFNPVDARQYVHIHGVPKWK